MGNEKSSNCFSSLALRREFEMHQAKKKNITHTSSTNSSNTNNQDVNTVDKKVNLTNGKL